jgi:hypothetical protein
MTLSASNIAVKRHGAVTDGNRLPMSDLTGNQCSTSELVWKENGYCILLCVLLWGKGSGKMGE